MQTICNHRGVSVSLFSLRKLFPLCVYVTITKISSFFFLFISIYCFSFIFTFFSSVSTKALTLTLTQTFAYASPIPGLVSIINIYIFLVRADSFFLFSFLFCVFFLLLLWFCSIWSVCSFCFVLLFTSYKNQSIQRTTYESYREIRKHTTLTTHMSKLYELDDSIRDLIHEYALLPEWKLKKKKERKNVKKRREEK